jgi:hypothetical protein
MRASLKKSIAVSLAALTLGVGLAASADPAAAGPFPFPKLPIKPFPIKPFPIKPLPGPIHHPGFYGGFGPGFALGVVGGAIAASSAYEPPDPCIQYRPVYDAWRNYIGQRPVNVCE